MRKEQCEGQVYFVWFIEVGRRIDSSTLLIDYEQICCLKLLVCPDSALGWIFNKKPTTDIGILVCTDYIKGLKICIEL